MDLTPNTGTVNVQATLGGGSCLADQTVSTTYTAPASCESAACTIEDIQTVFDCKGDTYDLVASVYHTGTGTQNFFAELKQEEQDGNWQQSLETADNPVVIVFEGLPVDGELLQIGVNMVSEANGCGDRLRLPLTAPASCPCQLDTIIHEQKLNGNRYDLMTKVFFHAKGEAKVKVALNNGLSQERMVDFSPATFMFDELDCEGEVVTVEVVLSEGDCEEVESRVSGFYAPLNCDGDTPPDDAYCPENCPITIGEPWEGEVNCTNSDIAPDDIKVCYTWQLGSTPLPTEDICSPTIQVCPPRTTVYTQVVTDNCGNILDIREYLVEIKNLEVAITPNPAGLCPGNSEVTLDAGNFFETYQWSTGANTREITVGEVGIYSVTVTDENGCEAIGEVEVTLGDAPFEVILGLPNAFSCPDSPVELIALTLPSIESPIYSWSTGDNTQSITVMSGEEYSVTVSDSEGCQATKSEFIDTLRRPIISIIAAYPSICEPDMEGRPSNRSLTECINESTMLYADTGLPGYSYLWSTGETESSIEVTVPGIYTVTVTEDGECSSTTFYEVTSCADVEIDLALSQENTILDAGEGYQSYRWDNGSTEQTLQISTPGTYAVTVVNENGCMASDEITISQFEYDPKNIYLVLYSYDTNRDIANYFVCNSPPSGDDRAELEKIIKENSIGPTEGIARNVFWLEDCIAKHSDELPIDKTVNSNEIKLFPFLIKNVNGELTLAEYYLLPDGSDYGFHKFKIEIDGQVDEKIPYSTGRNFDINFANLSDLVNANLSIAEEDETFTLTTSMDIQFRTTNPDTRTYMLYYEDSPAPETLRNVCACPKTA